MFISRKRESLFAEPEERASTHVALVRGWTKFRHAGRKRFQDRVDHRRKRNTPLTERCRRPGAQHRSIRQLDIERTEATLVDVEFR